MPWRFLFARQWNILIGEYKVFQFQEQMRRLEVSWKSARSTKRTKRLPLSLMKFDLVPWFSGSRVWPRRWVLRRAERSLLLETPEWVSVDMLFEHWNTTEPTSSSLERHHASGLSWHRKRSYRSALAPVYVHRWSAVGVCSSGIASVSLPRVQACFLIPASSMFYVGGFFLSLTMHTLYQTLLR